MKENEYDRQSMEKLHPVASFIVRDIPEIKEGDDIGEIIFQKMELLGGIREKDIFVIASKVVSK